MWKWFITILSLCGALFAVRFSMRSVEAEAVPPPFQEPVRNPYSKGIAGNGLVEPESENIMIGVVEAGRVDKVYVKRNQEVKKGDKLYSTDTRAQEAQLVALKAAVNTSAADLERVKAFRRKEDEPGLRARVAEAAASITDLERTAAQSRKTIEQYKWELEDYNARLARLKLSVAQDAWPKEDLENMKFTINMSSAKLDAAKEQAASADAKILAARARQQQAQNDLDIFLAGPWPPDVHKAEAVLDEAKAKVKQVELEIERRTLVAPIDGTVLRCNLREGEFATASAPANAEQAAVVIGNLKVLHVRVDIDEYDSVRFKSGAKAVGKVKGDPKQKLIALDFVRIEPFVVPKRALTNSQRELVDTRVLQVIYKLAEPSELYVGQQVDVFIEDKQ